MKSKLIFVFVLFISLLAEAQTYPVNLHATLKKGYEKMKKGETVTITGVSHSTELKNTYATGTDNPAALADKFVLIINEKEVPIKDDLDEVFDFKFQTAQDVWDAMIICKVLAKLEKKGMQVSLRKEMENDALDYITRVKSSGLELKDPYLENYVYSVIAKLAPEIIIDGRPGNINILLVDDASENACMYPNGTLILHSGLIARLHSEDELAAILSHEIAHFILDHSVQNVNKAIARKKRAEFWAAVATGITAAAEVAAASKNRYYVPGAATIGMAVLTSSIASQVVERLGMLYNHEQEAEADAIAKIIITQAGYDSDALATALNRLQESMVKERSTAMYFASYTHPSLIKRISDAGTPKELNDKRFERIVSAAVSSAARMKFEDRRFRQAYELFEQNINLNVATSSDYVMQAQCMLCLKDTKESNSKALEWVNQAKLLSPQNINIVKAEILIRLRLNQTAQAITLLEEYQTRLQTMDKETKSMYSEALWTDQHLFVEEELLWADGMVIRLNSILRK